MHGYSDRVSHAFAFSAKYYGARPPATSPMAYLAHPANVAVILARYGADEVTLVAGVLHHALEEAVAAQRAELSEKIREKFGPVVLGVATDALEPRFDQRGIERPWRACKHEFLAHLAEADPRALDICVAEEIQGCGNTATSIRRLGAEYVRTVSRATSEQTVWWYRSMIEVLASRTDWPTRRMLDELRTMSANLLRNLRAMEDEQ
ncbi:MAG TPA: HD domain-containing protein [Gemmatimonadales bacterium]|nr:HD domain-containing protein [Gemmatimonadales bacterium]